ncbi:MAG: hypothetical protein N2D54_06200 [Chloroflexota bacterium]
MTSEFEKVNIALYPISWLDNLINWIKSLPLPAWVYYLLSLVIIAYLNNWVLVLAGAIPAGEINLETTTDALWFVYFIAFFHYLKETAREALKKYQPLLMVDEAEYRDIENKFTNLPARLGWLAIGVSVTIFVLFYFSIPETAEEIRTYPLLTNSYQLLFRFSSISIFSAFLIQSIRQIKHISHHHRTIKHISLFHLGPAHAFSILTSKMGIGLILIAIFGIFQLVYLGVDAVFGIVHLMFLMVALAAFVLPLGGMRAKLLEKRESMLDELDSRIEKLYSNLNQQIDTNNLENTKDYPRLLQALRTERAAIEKISMWPWDTSTLKGFATTFLIPIVLWAITRLLESYF